VHHEAGGHPVASPNRLIFAQRRDRQQHRRIALQVRKRTFELGQSKRERESRTQWVSQDIDSQRVQITAALTAPDHYERISAIVSCDSRTIGCPKASSSPSTVDSSRRRTGIIVRQIRKELGFTMSKKIHIRSYEVGLKFRDDEFVALIDAGKHFVFTQFGKTNVRVVSKRDPWLVDEQLDVIVKTGVLAEKANILDMKDHERR
jgi:hypothetical protein